MPLAASRCIPLAGADCGPRRPRPHWEPLPIGESPAHQIGSASAATHNWASVEAGAATLINTASDAVLTHHAHAIAATVRSRRRGAVGRRVLDRRLALLATDGP